MIKKVCETCGDEFEADCSKRKYCSRTCAAGYTEADRNYICENYGVVDTKTLAAKYGVLPETLRRMICYWRNVLGWEIGVKRECPKAVIGEVRTRNKRGVPYDVVRTEKGWERVNAPALGRPFKKIIVQQFDKPKKDNDMSSAKQTNYNSQKQGVKRRNEERLKTRVIDLSECRPVHIPEMNMTVYTKSGQTVEAVRKYWLNHRKRELQGGSAFR